jgi:hypothetical protein
MALCLGANLTIFAVVDSILLRALPFPQAESPGIGARATGRAMQHLLFGIGSVHLGVVAATAGVMIGAVLLATSVPSCAASRISPTEALRDE